MDERRINLESLRQAAPPSGLWAAISADLERRQLRRKAWKMSVSTVTVAAALVVTVLVVRLMDAPSPGQEEVMAQHGGELVELQERAAELGRELAGRRDGVVNGAALESLVWMEAELRWLDEQLSAAPRDKQLWRERVDLLEEMNRRYAEQDWRYQPVLTGI